MSRIVSGKLCLDVQDVDLAALVRAGAETVKPAADAKGVALQVIVDSSAGHISGDPQRLHQVFWNLVSNAVKFTPKGGKVQVELRRVESHIEASVADTGEGIEGEFLPFVFERFRQADASTTRHYGGLGLGLAIVKQIVELHGGSVRASSPGKNQGATFTVRLPIAIARQAPDENGGQAVSPMDGARPILASKNQLAGVTALVVDDEADAAAFVERLLTGCGAAVHTASSAPEALMLVEIHRPMIIVSDIGMPGEDGYSFMRKVRTLPPERGGRTLSVALTAYARTVDRVRALEAGFQVHIAKPVDPSELIASVAALAITAKAGS
jgi:CheY-like chemotaxis protein/two-component sensor histidine kinase